MIVYVLFTDTGRGRGYWWDFLSSPGRRHCAVFIPDERGVSVCLEYSFGLLSATILGCNHVDEAVHKYGVKLPISSIIEVDLEKREHSKYIPVRCMTCVGMAKAVLGIKAWWVWTPEQLYRYLLSHGGCELWVV